MEFKDWVANNSNFDWLFEFMDVKSMSTDHIQFQTKKGIESITDEEDYYSILDGDNEEEDTTLTYQFKIGPFNYKVVFEKRLNFFSRVANSMQQYGSKNFDSKSETNLIYKSIPNLNFWMVDFYGPQGLQTTNQNKNVAFIYKNLLLAVKKLIETEKVDVLHFNPAEQQMALIYNKFYKQFLSNDFFRVDTFQFLNKEIIEKIMNGDYGDKLKEQIPKVLSLASNQADQEFEKIKDAKRKQRELLKSVPKGKIFQYETTFVSPVTHARENGVVPVMVLDSLWFQGQAHYKVVALYNKNKIPFVIGSNPNFNNPSDFTFVSNQSYKPSQLKEPTHPIIVKNFSSIKSLLASFLN